MTLDEWTRNQKLTPLSEERLTEILCWRQRHCFAADGEPARIVGELLLEVARLRKDAEQ